MRRAVLDKLIAHSFANHHVVDHHGFHTHTAHHLGSLYHLNATADRLEELYRDMHDEVNMYEPSPYEITRANWRELLGDKRFCKAYQEFFDRELTASGDHWQQKFLELLLENPAEPMINGVVGGVAHPLIHIGYAFELNNRVVACEALALSAVCYNYLHNVIDKLKPPKSGSKSALEIFQDLRLDDRLSMFDAPGVRNIEPSVKESTDLVIAHYDEWFIDMDNIEKVIEELFDLTVYLYAATHKPDQIDFDFFLLHLLTSMHAIRHIYSHLNDRQVIEHLLWQFFYFASILYIAQLRPEINRALVHDYRLEDGKNTWDYVVERTVNTELAEHSHFVKVVRTLRDAEVAYGAKDGFYLKAAVKTIDNVNIDNMWIGGPSNPRQLNILKRA